MKSPLIVLCFAGAAAMAAMTAAAADAPAPATKTEAPAAFSAAQPAAQPDALPEGFGAGPAAQALRRFEIVSLGSFPIVLFYSDFLIDLGTYIAKGFDAGYAPWPFKNELSIQPSTSERLGRIGMAVAASCAVGIADALIRGAEEKRSRAAARAAAAAAPPPAAAHPVSAALPAGAADPGMQRPAEAEGDGTTLPGPPSSP